MASPGVVPVSATRLFAAILTLDELIRKAKSSDDEAEADPWIRNMALEKRLFQVLSRIWLKRAQEGVSRAMQPILAGQGDISQAEFFDAMAAFRDAFRGFALEVAPMLGEVVGQSYMFGKELGLRQAAARTARIHKAKAKKPKEPANLSDAELAAKIAEVEAKLAAAETKLAHEKAMGAAAATKIQQIEAEFAVHAAKEAEHASVLSTAEAAEAQKEAALIALQTAEAAAKPKGKKAGPSKGSKYFEIKPSFTLQDKQAIKAIGDMQISWISDFAKNEVTGDKLSNKIQIVAGRALTLGLPRKDVANDLQKELLKHFGLGTAATDISIVVPGWKGSPLSYFEMLAANVTTVARNTGQLRSYTEIGITHYEVINPKDEKTCPRCNFMNGKVFEVASSAEREQKIADQVDPEKVKQLHPWANSVKEMIAASGASDKQGHVSHEDSKKLEAAGFSMAPYHGKCRCSIDIAEDSKIEYEEAPAAPPPPPPEPAPAQTHFDLAPLHEEEAPTPKLTVSPPLPPPSLIPSVAPLHEPEEKPPAAIGFPWKESQLVEKPEQLGGMHTKHVFVDPNGQEWIFKPVEHEFRALGDVMANNLQRLVGLPTNEFHLVTLKGRIGSIQTRFKDVTAEIKSLAPHQLSTDQVGQLQREHIFDWLISQHDTHHENVLVLKDGTLRGIDKGQTFRFFGKDRFDLSYGQAGEPNPSATYYHTLFNAYASGKNVQLPSWEHVDEFLKSIEAIDDQQYLGQIRRYAKSAKAAADKDPAMKRAAWMGRYSEDEFLGAVLQRKQDLRASVEAFYDELEQRRAKALGIPFQRYVNRNRATKPVDETDRKTWAQRIKNAAQGQWDGATWFVGGSDYEGMTFKLYSVRDDGSFIETKIRSAAHDRLVDLLGLKKLSNVQPQSPTAPADPYHATVLAAIKSWNYHMTPGSPGYDGVVPEKHTAALKALLPKMQQAAKGAPGSFEANAALHNISLLEQAFDAQNATWKNDMLGKVQVTPYVHPTPAPQPSAPPAVKQGLPVGWTVQRVGSSMPVPLGFPSGGEVVMGARQARASYDNQVKDAVIKLTAPDGTIFFYHPHGNEADIKWAAQGKLKIQLAEGREKLTPERLQSAMRQLESLGLSSATATAEDMELIYLRKVAYKEKIDIGTNGTNKTVAETLPVADQIARLKEELTSQKGISFPKGYDYLPSWDRATEGVGTARFLAHYIDVQKAGLSDLRLFSSLTYGGGGDQLSKLKPIIEGGTHSLLPTIERARVGVWSETGGSESADITSGGANYVFNRIRHESLRRPGLYMRAELFRDLDSIVYSHDMFGNTHPEKLAERVADRSEYRKLAQYVENSDETAVKNGIDLRKWLDKIVVETESERRKTIAFFKQQGFNEYAGKKIEDLVQVGKYP